MSRHPYTLVESFYRCPRQPDVQPFMYQLKRDAVIMAGYFYVLWIVGYNAEFDMFFF
jgi:hypothetical protein